MAARMNPAHDKRTRLKIQTSQLINRLNSFVLGECDMSPAQVNAAKILLGKTLPDLKSMELAGEGGSALKIEIVKAFSGD